MIKQTTATFIKKELHIERARDIGAQVHKEHGVSFSDRRIIDVFKNEFGLKFCAVKKIAFHGNSEMNLVLR